LKTVHSLRFWWSHLQVPFALFVVTATVFAVTPLDEHIARAVFFDAASAQWIGAHSWVINELLHTAGTQRDLACAGLHPLSYNGSKPTGVA